VPQLDQDVLEELERDGLGGGERLTLESAVGGGQLESGTNRIVGLGGDPHGGDSLRKTLKSA
jgi:hypothetical protein